MQIQLKHWKCLQDFTKISINPCTCAHPLRGLAWRGVECLEWWTWPHKPEFKHLLPLGGHEDPRNTAKKTPPGDLGQVTFTEDWEAPQTCSQARYLLLFPATCDSWDHHFLIFWMWMSGFIYFLIVMAPGSAGGKPVVIKIESFKNM